MLGTSLALLFLPPFIEQQRLEFEEMQNMQKKQVTSINFKMVQVRNGAVLLTPHTSFFTSDSFLVACEKNRSKTPGFHTLYILPL